MRLLLIEDEQLFAENVKQLLQTRGFVIDHVDSAEKGLNRLRLYREDYAVVLLDISLPQMNGIELTQILRAEHILVPIIIVSAIAEANSKVRALNSGADDYVVKPFSTDELAARIRVILRRPRRRNHAHPQQLGSMMFNSQERKIIANGSPLALTGKEYALFERIAQKPNEIVTSNELRNVLWSGDVAHDSNVLAVHIKNLRKKLGKRARVETVRGIGYKLIV